MEKRLFTSIGREISLLGFGFMRLPLQQAGKQDIDYEKAEAMVDLAMSRGVNYYDTAYLYHDGLSEPFAGRSLSRYPRESYCLATKMPTWDITSADQVERIFDEQLKRCRVDYFDFYLLHRVSRVTYDIALKYDIYGILRRKKEQGLIKHLGFSFHDAPPVLERVLDNHEWDFGQLQLNYLDWQDLDAARQYALLAERKLPVIVMEPIRGGALADLGDEGNAILRAVNPKPSIASWALRYAASLPGVLTVLSGMSNQEQVEDNLATMQAFKPLDETEREAIERAVNVYRSSSVIPCTGCRYCMDCPSGVDIPRVFTVYNLYCVKKSRRLFHIYYDYLAESERAHNCVGCGACLERCPQGIDIPGRMCEIADFAAGPKTD
ncbi:MAG: aldo/keto reductase [Deltaproteobacteria bacterium]|jgi:predicted aldo/keto reductase-like oxidoreductase|nr:aldo/keto reductase [Deltaproteobacteria bacterium]